MTLIEQKSYSYWQKIFRHTLLLLGSTVLLFVAGCGKNHNGALLNQAVADARANNWQECEKNAVSVLKDNPIEPSALLLRAIAAENLGKLDVARESARLAAENAPSSFAAQYTYGRLLAMRPDSTKNAVQVLKRALELRPDDVNTLILLGQSCSKLNSDEAITYFTKLPSEVLQKPEIRTSMAIYYLDRRDSNRAYMRLGEIMLGNAYRTAPNKPEVVLNLALYIDHYQHKRSRAKGFYQRYLRLTENNPELNPTRAQVKARISKLR